MEQIFDQNQKKKTNGAKRVVMLQKSKKSFETTSKSE
jgi:hypothetical protein